MLWLKRIQGPIWKKLYHLLKFSVSVFIFMYWSYKFMILSYWSLQYVCYLLINLQNSYQYFKFWKVVLYSQGVYWAQEAQISPIKNEKIIYKNIKDGLKLKFPPWVLGNGCSDQCETCTPIFLFIYAYVSSRWVNMVQFKWQK